MRCGNQLADRENRPPVSRETQANGRPAPSNGWLNLHDGQHGGDALPGLTTDS